MIRSLLVLSRHVTRMRSVRVFRFSKKRVLLTAAIGISVFYGITCWVSRPVVFRYGAQTCRTELIAFPGLQRNTPEGAFAVTYQDNFGLRSMSLFSVKTCFVPRHTPSSGRSIVKTAAWGLPMLSQRYAVHVPPPPAVLASQQKVTLAMSRPLALKLDSPDDTFTYFV